MVGVVLSACAVTNEPLDALQPSRGVGGDAGTSGAAGGEDTTMASVGSVGGSAPSCAPELCEGVDSECAKRACTESGECAFEYAPAGTELDEQTDGDCRRAICDGRGGVDTNADNSDPPLDDGNPCATSICHEGAPETVYVPEFVSCYPTPGMVCDGAGECLACAGGEADCFSDGSDGAFSATQDIEISGGVYDFTTFAVDAGVTVTVTGADPLWIQAQGYVAINGTLSASGAPGTDAITFNTHGFGGLGLAGGGNGGDGSFNGGGQPPLVGADGHGGGGGNAGINFFGGAGAGYASAGFGALTGSAAPGPAYGNALLEPFLGGSGGGGGSGGNNCGGGGGGAGGGAIKITAFGSITIAVGAAVFARGGKGGTDNVGGCGGGGGGSGGAVWLQAASIINHGQVNVIGGLGGDAQSDGGAGADGRIRVDAESFSGSGVVIPAPGHLGGSWYQ